MEPIITIVGFLGAGKTTLLKHLIKSCLESERSPFIILNDYANASLEIQQFNGWIEKGHLKALNGSCICCSGISELRDFVNNIPERKRGITLIEANGTSDACSLMGFLGVGIDSRFLPPIQVSVADLVNWQNRGEYNELEANQIQMSSLIVLTHIENISKKRELGVRKELQALNPTAQITTMNKIDVSFLYGLTPSRNEAKKLNHLDAHWSSCSTDLPTLPDIECIYEICKLIPKTILRIKGCTKIGIDNHYTYFERVANGTISIKPFNNGSPITGPKLLIIGPGSKISLLNEVIDTSIRSASFRSPNYS